MTAYGYSLMCELHHPDQLLDQARQAEQAGFDFLTISDHIHPWLYSHHHSPFAWSVLGALAAQTEQVDLVSLVTCPIIRYHPVIVAQMSATVAAMSGGRFRLGVGAGENLNEHVTGSAWPPVHVRHEMLAEAIGIIRMLHEGGYRSFEGKHYTVNDARIFTLPDEPPPVYVAASGPAALRVAAELGDGYINTEPRADLVEGFRASVPHGPVMGQMAVSVDDDRDRALRTAHERFRFAASGWKVQSELPNPKNFEAATAAVREDDMADLVPSGTEVEPYVEAVDRWLDAGYDHLALAPVGDPARFFEFWKAELGPALREREPASA
jgi:G6PDH family F420-dependent oxidoreductase